MEVKQFNRLLANPVFLDETTVEALKTLTEEYPYFQVAWMLYLKNLKQIKSPEFEVVLKQVAVRVSDRKKLYNFLNTNFHKKPAKVKLEGEALSSYKLKGDAENNWEDHIIEDVVSYVDDNFRTVPRREGRAISGLSMGGFGAFSLALRHPDMFVSMGSTSGAISHARAAALSRVITRPRTPR